MKLISRLLLPIIAPVIATAIVVSVPASADPTRQVAARASGDIVETAAASGQFNTFIVAIKAAGLEETLRSSGPYTVFAPTDAAFAKMPKGQLQSLLWPENKQKLASILKYHVVPGKVMSKDLAGKKAKAPTAQGAKLSLDASRGLKVDNVRVIKADVAATNGVIHVIDTVLVPKSR